METVKVKIEGITPLLQHRFPEEEHPEHKSKKKIKEYPANAEAEKGLYKDEKGDIFQPASTILGSLIKASTSFQYDGRKTYKEVMSSSVFITPEFISLKSKWVIDRRPVRVQGARIMRARPRFDKWILEFHIEYDEELVSKEKLKEILDFAGQRKGIGDFRPRYGRFIVTKFE